MRWCDRHDVGYLLGLARNTVLEKLARPWTEVSAAQFARTNQKQRLFGEFVYGAETWDRRRRVIIKAEHLDLGPNRRFLVINLAGEPQRLYDEGPGFGLIPVKSRWWIRGRGGSVRRRRRAGHIQHSYVLNTTDRRTGRPPMK